MPFYEELATKLLAWRSRQPELLAFIEDLRNNKHLKITPLEDRGRNDERFTMRELDPFTFFACFNRGITNSNRLAILREIKAKFGCVADLPQDFAGIPVANNQNSWYVAYQKDRGDHDVDTLWSVFAAALGADPLNDPAFADAFDRALNLHGVNLNLTMGLFWIRPRVFLNLDGTMRAYLKVKIPSGGLSWTNYSAIMQRVRKEHEKPVHVLSLEAFNFKEPSPTKTEVTSQPGGGGVNSQPGYGVDDALAAGVFLSKDELRFALRHWESKRNLILQGAPGVGKTFVARKLAYALIEEEDAQRVEFVQFHPSYSYEDFIRGYRPTESAGHFELRDGPFVRFCQRAARDSERRYVLIIDEVNRGNLSQVFGELFMLLEADKRGEANSITPLYQRSDSERFSVPENLYVIGTMNIADRSLALVDFALRRRFAFVTLEPKFADESYQRWLRDRMVADDLISLIVNRMTALNETISADSRLGAAFRIGHSFFCPRGVDSERLDVSWFREVVRSEIDPLLREYWYDEPDKVKSAVDALLA